MIIHLCVCVSFYFKMLFFLSWSEGSDFTKHHTFLVKIKWFSRVNFNNYLNKLATDNWQSAILQLPGPLWSQPLISIYKFTASRAGWNWIPCRWNRDVKLQRHWTPLVIVSLSLCIPTYHNKPVKIWSSKLQDNNDRKNTLVAQILTFTSEKNSF